MCEDDIKDPSVLEVGGMVVIDGCELKVVSITQIEGKIIYKLEMEI